jgi:DNA-binding NtrC family response regulator
MTGRNAADTTAKALVAVIDDDEAARLSVGQMLRLRRFEVKVFTSAEASLAWPSLPNADAVICDVKMPGMSGEDFLAEMARHEWAPPVILVTGHGDVSMAVRCLKSGAYDFVEKPFEDDVLLACVARAVEKSALRRESAELRRRLAAVSTDEDGRHGLIGRSRAMQDVYDQIDVVARSSAPVLVWGETGTGKELVARAIHDQSPRARGPFVALNAGALPETMLESELFGHARGAFTGADAARDGKMVAASGGTLMLDEVESIPIRAQLQLLRVLEDGLVYPLGRDAPRKVDIRLVATTKVDLAEQVRKGQMREDFYHRILVLQVHLPALRERTEDIPLLVGHFLKQAATRNGVQVPQIPDESLAAMLGHPWPGNVRELKHAVERMVITARDGRSGTFAGEEQFDATRLLSLPPGAGRLREALETTEHHVIRDALERHGGEVTATALGLGISRRALYERMKKYGLSREDYQE